MAKNYTVHLNDGSEITIEGVAKVAHDGMGIRFMDANDDVLAGFTSVSSYHPVSTKTKAAPAETKS